MSRAGAFLVPAGVKGSQTGLDGLEQVSEDAALVASLAVSHVFGSRHMINQHHAAQQAALQHNLQHMIIQQNNRRMANMLLSRPALAEVVHELVQSPPTEDELRLLAQVQELEPEQIENRLRDTRLWQLLAVLGRNDVRVLAYLTLLLMIFQTYLMMHPPQAGPPAPQVTVNVTVDADSCVPVRVRAACVLGSRRVRIGGMASRILGKLVSSGVCVLLKINLANF
jgi:hypothetical protein